MNRHSLPPITPDSLNACEALAVCSFSMSSALKHRAYSNTVSFVPCQKRL
ncbi:hypothetical protein GCWU000342_00242 [Shuttleworthella satelles DSM 14600]|uniref:Uncharacterized protein n=1 Tax=Shuttleworthella satelles DSM 14600 TaxID=626523 RepID=C4G8E7_9FIRM|nr:hypothetical protein GCWU000342_00242 [Shuttleworthia satelles DSM 14600]